MAKIKINETEYYYELHGSGEPLVLVAGYCSDHRHWLPILDQLAKHFQVLIFDNRAIGQTMDNNSSLSTQIMADDTMMLAATLGLDNPSFIGHSMGGTIVQDIALRYPNKINKIAILQSSSKWRQAMLKGLNSILNMRKENTTFNLQFEAILAWVFGDAFLQNKVAVESLKNVILSDEFPQSLNDQIRQFEVLENFNNENRISDIQAPTLVASGIQDIISLPYESLKLAKGIPGAKFVSVNCGHNMILEAPEETIDILLSFFAD